MPRTLQMPRAKLKECIESGITHAQDSVQWQLSDDDAAKLRDVGETITHVAYGDWCQSNSVSCGCPVVEAGLVDVGPDGKPMKSRPEYGGFASWYDNAVIRWGMAVNIFIEAMGIIVVEDSHD